MKRIAITGATGLIGKALSKALIQRGDEVTVLSRNASTARSLVPDARHYANWDYTADSSEIAKVVADKDAVIHLAGAPVAAHSWTPDYKEEIINSRVLSTRNLVQGMQQSDRKPAVFISASAIGYYGNTFDTEINEESPAADDFLGMVCAAWEAEAAQAEPLGIRRVSVRIGIVLSTKDGALSKLLTPFRLFIGGPLGNGKQWFSWVHIDDIVRAFLHVLDTPEIHGAVNCTAPQPVRMKDFAKRLGKVLRRPSLFPVPEFVLKFILGESAQAVLSGQKVNPVQLINHQFVFLFPEVSDALKDILSNRK